MRRLLAMRGGSMTLSRILADMESPRAEIPAAVIPTGEVTAASRLLTLVGIVVVIAGLYFGRQVLIPLALAVVLAFLLTPLVALLEKGHFGRVPSVLAALVLSFAILTAAGWGVANQLMESSLRSARLQGKHSQQDRSN